MSQNSNLFLSVGKPVKDEYGHVVGKITSFAVTPSGKFDAAFIEQGNGKFLRHSTEHLKFDGADVLLVSRIKFAANTFCDQIPLIWRKSQALKNLSEKKKISPELCSELHTSFEGALSQLKNEAQALSAEVDAEIAECDEETRILNYALVNLEIEHEIGKIDDKNYENALALIQENLKRIHLKKTDLVATESKLANILLGDVSKAVAPEPCKSKAEAPKGSVYSAPELPEPPVVVYVKEIGKAGL